LILLKYYRVKAKCGHVGRNNYILKDFYVKATNGKEAAKQVRYTPRVKHHQKDAIQKVEEISLEEYVLGRKVMAEDMYFKVHNSTDQRWLNAVDKLDIFPEMKKERYKRSRLGQYMKNQLLEKEWRKTVQRGYTHE